MRLAVLASAAAFVPMCLSVSPLVAPVGAQAGVAPACDIQGSISKEVATPWFNFSRAKGAANVEAKRTSLKAVLKELGEKPERFAKNPVGYNYVLSQTLSLWLVDPAMSPVTTRGAIGFTTMPDQSYDLIEHIDSAFTAIVAASPNCAQEVAQQRQNEGWLAIVRKSLEASNTGAMDSAVYFANQSLRLSKDSPYPYYVLASAANSKQDFKGAIENWKKLVDVAGKDTSYKDMRLSSYFYLGMRILDQAQGGTGDAQKTQAMQAATWLRQYMAEEATTSSDLPTVMASLADALELAGQKDQMKTVYQPLLANTANYDDFSLTMGGVIATRLTDQPSAITMFQAAVAKNPQSRDALRNLSATFYATKEFDKMWSPLKALVQLDPNNSDAWLMNAYAAQGLSLAAKTPAEKKAWTDTLVKYSTIADNLPAKVEVTAFSRSKDGSSVSISVEQQAAAAGNYTVTMEFLDAKGAVVATDQKSMGPIEKGAKKRETFKTKNPDVVSFRYKPLG